ncbi:MAG: restriction endonuclease subunit S [Verrucomicrobiales bacterium]
MEGDWRASTWGDEISLEYGKALRNYDKERGKFRVFGSNGPIGWTSQPLAPGPGVILGRKGAYRGIEFSREPFFVIDTAYYVVPKTEFDMRWLYYAIKYHKLGEIDDGSPIPSTTRSAVYVRDFDIPPLAEQKAIAAVLGALDDKIELNRRMNATLEAMARALFQSWFIDFDPVRWNLDHNQPSPQPSPTGRGRSAAEGEGAPGLDFDPVRAKLDARPPTGLDSATADLFPATFQYSPVGHIPTGWRAAHLGDVVSVFDSKRVPLSGREREQRKGSYPYHGAASVMDYVDDYLFDGIYTLMGEDGSVINEDGTPVMQYVWGKFWVNNHAHVLQGKNGVCTEHLLLHLKNSNIAAFVTGAVQPKLNQGNMNRIPFILPPPEIGEVFAKTIEPLFAQIRANTDQSRTLATLRDTLLPKLLSGELPVELAHFTNQFAQGQWRD